MAKNEKGRELFIAHTPAETPDGMILPGAIAEAGALILKKYAALFKPLEVTYKA